MKIPLKETIKLIIPPIQVNGRGKFVIKQFPPERKRIDIGSYYSDYNLIQKTLDWEPEITLSDGLNRTLNFYRGNLQYYL